jgi:hypothetical protein
MGEKFFSAESPQLKESRDTLARCRATLAK